MYSPPALLVSHHRSFSCNIKLLSGHQHHSDSIAWTTVLYHICPPTDNTRLMICVCQRSEKSTLHNFMYFKLHCMKNTDIMMSYTKLCPTRSVQVHFIIIMSLCTTFLRCMIFWVLHVTQHILPRLGEGPQPVPSVHFPNPLKPDMYDR